MGKLSAATLLGKTVIAIALLGFRTTVAHAQVPFKDVPPDHWAYQALSDLQSKGILKGYPDGYFRGTRTLTRFEMAVAINRALKELPPAAGQPGEPGPVGPQGEPGPAGPPGMTPEEIANFRRLVGEFGDELKGLRTTVAAANRRIDGLERTTSELRGRLDRMPVFYGGAWIGLRLDVANGTYADRDGRVQLPQSSGSIRNTPAVVQDYLLGVRANIPGGARLDAAITVNNYKNYEGGDLALTGPNSLNPLSDTYLHHLAISAPIHGIAQRAAVTFGRFGMEFGPYTLARPQTDSYLIDPFQEGRWQPRGWGGTGQNAAQAVGTSDEMAGGEVVAGGANGRHGHGLDGNGTGYSKLGENVLRYSPVFDGSASPYYIDGVKGYASCHHLTFTGVAGKFSSVTGSSDFSSALPWNIPIAGTTTLPTVSTIFNNGVKPLGEYPFGHMFVDRLAAVNVKDGFQLGGRPAQVGFTAMGLWGSMESGNNFDNVLLFGAHAKVPIFPHVALSGEWAKTITGTGSLSTVNPYQNNAFNASVGYGSRNLSVNAGYRYIDPLFYAPGYWGRIGNWINPTNVAGPTFLAQYNFTGSGPIMTIGGEFFSAAHDQAGSGGLSRDDDISRILVGLRKDVTNNVRASVDWEGVYWSLKNSHSGIPALGTSGVAHPTEHYIDIGATYRMMRNMTFRVAYQIGEFDGHNAIGIGPSNRYSFNAFTTQMAVRF